MITTTEMGNIFSIGGASIAFKNAEHEKVIIEKIKTRSHIDFDYLGGYDDNRIQVYLGFVKSRRDVPGFLRNSIYFNNRNVPISNKPFQGLSKMMM